MDKIQKFLLSLSKKERRALLNILSDIRVLKFHRHDVKPLKGQKGLFRLRKGKIRIIFAKEETMGFIVNIGHRKDIYR